MSQGESSVSTMSSILLECMKVKRVEQSPFKITGPGLPVWVSDEGDYVRVRVDMPGVNSVTVKPDPHKNSIGFEGLEQNVTMHGIGSKGGVCRVYQGSFQFDFRQFPGLDFTCVFRDGVLVLLVRCRYCATTADAGVSLMLHQTQALKETRESAINPLLTGGKDRYCLDGFTKKAFMFAVDMPGISEHDTLILDAVGDTINFYAQGTITQGSNEESVNEERREYEGNFKVDMKELDTSKFQFEINHGVLWILLPELVKTEAGTELIPM